VSLIRQANSPQSAAAASQSVVVPSRSVAGLHCLQVEDASLASRPLVGRNNTALMPGRRADKPNLRDTLLDSIYLSPMQFELDRRRRLATPDAGGTTTEDVII